MTILYLIFICSEIFNHCQLDDKELRRTLQSVIDVKILILEPVENVSHLLVD